MSLDWTSLLVPKTPLLELILRGTVMYLALLFALRLLIRRHVGSLMANCNGEICDKSSSMKRKSLDI